VRKHLFLIISILVFVLTSCSPDEVPTATCYIYSTFTGGWVTSEGDPISIVEGELDSGSGGALITQSGNLSVSWQEEFFITVKGVEIVISRMSNDQNEDISLAFISNIFGFQLQGNGDLPADEDSILIRQTTGSTLVSGRDVNAVLQARTPDGLGVDVEITYLKVFVSEDEPNPFPRNDCDTPPITPDAPTLTLTPTTTLTPSITPTPNCADILTTPAAQSPFTWTGGALYPSNNSYHSTTPITIYLNNVATIPYTAVYARFVDDFTSNSTRSTTLADIYVDGVYLYQLTFVRNGGLTKIIDPALWNVPFSSITFDPIPIPGIGGSTYDDIYITAFNLLGSCLVPPTPTNTPTNTVTATPSNTPLQVTVNPTATTTRTPFPTFTQIPPTSTITTTPPPTNTLPPTVTLPPPPATDTPPPTNTPNPSATPTITNTYAPGETVTYEFGTPSYDGTPFGTPCFDCGGTPALTPIYTPDYSVTIDAPDTGEQFEGDLRNGLSTAVAQLNDLPNEIAIVAPDTDSLRIYAGYGRWLVSGVALQEIVGQTIYPIFQHMFYALYIVIFIVSVRVILRGVVLILKFVTWIMGRILDVLPF
jgi:hypothetical protein